jgi:hypothetical protein
MPGRPLVARISETNIVLSGSSPMKITGNTAIMIDICMPCAGWRYARESNLESAWSGPSLVELGTKSTTFNMAIL